MERDIVFLSARTRRITLITEKFHYIYRNGDRIIQKVEDLESDMRVHGMPGIKTPRSMFEDKYSQIYVSKLNL